MELSNEFDVSVPIAQAWAVLTDVERIAPCLPGAQLQEVEGDEYRGVVKVKVGPITAQYKGAAHFVEKDETNHKAVLWASGRDTRGQGNASASITAELTPKGDSTHVSVLTDLTITGKVAQFGRGVIGDVSVKLLDQFVENLESTVLSGESTAVAATTAATATADVRDRGDDEETTQLLASELTKVWQAGDAANQGVRAARPSLAPRPDLLAEEQRLSADPASASASAPANGRGVRQIESADVAPIDLLDAAGTPIVKRLLPLIGLAVVVALVVAVLRRRR
jgi:carbon monoxide dehydrogenase subunit G